MKNSKIILITGQARHGKDTIADWLVKHKGYKKYMVAKPLKDICRILFNFTEEQVNGNEKDMVDNRWDVTPRRCLQFIGTDLIRNQIGNILPGIGENIWIKSLTEDIKIELEKNPESKFVISDVRFENELSYLKSNLSISVYSIRVINPRLISLTEHISEKQTFLTDSTIINDSSFEKLYEKLTSLIYFDYY